MKCHSLQPVLFSVEMTCVSPGFGKPIKDGLSSHWGGRERETGAREDEGDAYRTEISVEVLGRKISKR